MEIYVYWFLLGLVLLGLEMVTGTFYLLVVAIAAAVGGVAALLGIGMAVELMLSALTGIIGIFILQRLKAAQTDDVSNSSFDVGQPVQVLKWNDNGLARVIYRGAEWDAELESTDTPRDATLYIASMHGSGLVLTHRKSPQH